MAATTDRPWSSRPWPDEEEVVDLSISEVFEDLDIGLITCKNWFWTIGSVIVDNSLSRIHRSTVLQNGKTTTLNSAEIKIVRTKVKTHLGAFVRWVINQRSIYIFNFLSWNDRGQDHCQLVILFQHIARFNTWRRLLWSTERDQVSNPISLKKS